MACGVDAKEVRGGWAVNPAGLLGWGLGRCLGELFDECWHGC